MTWFKHTLTPLQIAQQCGLNLLDELAAGDLDGAADFLLVHDTTAGTRKKYKPAGLTTALNLVTAAAAFATDNRLLSSDGTGRGAKVTSVQISGDNVTIVGNLTVSGTTITFDTETVTVEDPLIKLAKANSADILDIGLYGLYNDGTARYAGLFRDATDGKFRLFKNLTVEPTTTVNIGDGSFQLAPLVIGDLTADAMVGDSLVLGTDPTGSELLRVGGAIKLGSVTVFTSHALTSSTQGDMLKWAEFGYGNYSALRLGLSDRDIALGVNPASVAGGSFIGNGTEMLVNRNIKFLQPNAGSTNWEMASIVVGGIRIGADPSGTEELRITGAIHNTGIIKCDNTTDATGPTDTSASINTAGGLAVAKKIFNGDTTNATDKDTGALVTEGGIAAEQSIFAGGDLQCSGVLKIDGTQVVKEQQAAVADVSTADATDLTTVIALANAIKSTLNTVLARKRAHGLIAT